MIQSIQDFSKEPARSVPKPSRSKRVKPTQKQLGTISAAVDRDLKERSGSVCEIREKCNGSRATERAHTMGRRIISSRTTIDDLFHACTDCHIWFDRTAEGIRLRREVREHGTTAYIVRRG